MANGFGTPTNCPATGCQSSLLLPTTDCQQVQHQLSDCFRELADPRGSQGILHPFVSIVMIGLLATLGGAWGQGKRKKVYALDGLDCKGMEAPKSLSI